MKNVINQYGYLRKMKRGFSFMYSYTDSKGGNNINKFYIKYTKIREMELEFIKDWIDDILIRKELEEKYECPYTNLKTRARKLDIKRKELKDKIDLNILCKDYESSMLVKDILIKYKISDTSLVKLLHPLGIVKEIGCSNRKFSLNEEYFNILDHQNKYYILGLLYADGYNSEDRGTITLNLKYDDLDLLVKIKKEFESDRDILMIKNKTYNIIYPRFTINSRKLSSKLESLGVNQKKSLTLEKPSFINSESDFKHFLRGYIDGDGNIACHIYKNNRYTISFSICSTYNFLLYIQENLIKLFNINKTKITKVGNVFVLTVSQRYKVEKILDWIYGDAEIFMQRKYNEYLKIKIFNQDRPINRKIPNRKDYI